VPPYGGADNTLPPAARPEGTYGAAPPHAAAEESLPAAKTCACGYILGILFIALNWSVFVFTAGRRLF
jgi:hypothetical protein